MKGGSGDDIFRFNGATDLEDGDAIDGNGGSDTIQLDASAGAVTATIDFDDVTEVENITVYKGVAALSGGKVTLGIDDNDASELLDPAALTIDASALNAHSFDFNDTDDNGTNGDQDSLKTNLTITGGGKADTIFGSQGHDTISGGGYTTGDGGDILGGGSGNDSITGNAGPDTIYGEEGNDVMLSGGAGADNIQGGAGNDVLEGGTGADLVQGDGGADTLTGGAGNDSFNYTAVTDSQTSAVDTITDFTQSSLNATTGALVSEGDNIRLTFTLADGDNTFTLSDKGDETQGLVTSLLSGTTKGDFAFATDISTLFIDKDGDGSLNADDWKIKLTGLTTFHDDDIDLYITAGAGGDSITGADGDDSITGVTGVNDTLDGDGGDDTINGVAGNNKIYGGPGNDSLTGGGGDDSIIGGDTNADTAAGSSGNDTIVSGNGADTAYGGEGNDSITGGTGVDKLYGQDGNDTITGDAGNDSLYGGAGNDSVTDAAGVSSLEGGAGNDTLDGGAGDADTVKGGDGNDLVKDGAGTSTLLGEAGDDTLLGGAGIDSMVGGTGSDTFDVTDVLLTANHADIEDFADIGATTTDVIKIAAANTTVATAAGSAPVVATLSHTAAAANATIDLTAANKTSVATNAMDILELTAANLPGSGNVTGIKSGADLFTALSNNDAAAIAGLTVADGAKFYILAYDENNAYLLHADAGAGNGTVVAGEVNLIAMIDNAGNITAEAFVAADFILG